MCESSVFIEKENGRELLMSEVVHVGVNGKDIELSGILGESRKIKGSVKEINLMEHTIIIEIL